MFNWGPECYFWLIMCVASMRIFPYLGHMKCGEWVFLCACVIKIHNMVNIKWERWYEITTSTFLLIHFFILCYPVFLTMWSDEHRKQQVMRRTHRIWSVQLKVITVGCIFVFLFVPLFCFSLRYEPTIVPPERSLSTASPCSFNVWISVFFSSRLSPSSVWI